MPSSELSTTSKRHRTSSLSKVKRIAVTVVTSDDFAADSLEIRRGMHRCPRNQTELMQPPGQLTPRMLLIDGVLF